MTCAACGTINAEGRRFCLECGTALVSGCPTCGSPNEPGAKFCGTCGSRLVAVGIGAGGATTGGPASPSGGGAPSLPVGTGSGAGAPGGGFRGPVAERRQVTVLFADLVGFTTLSAERDPEAVRELLGRYFERCREIIGRYGGTVEKFIGDAVMAVWGAPIAREDDAERAVRSALELVDAVPVLGREAGLDLQVRAGVLTGEAAVTLGATNQGMVAGDLVNTASRLQSVAAPGTVLVGEATRSAAESAIVFEPAGEQVLKGKPAPVPSWIAIRVVGERGGAGRPDALEPPFVGRADELRFLKEQFHATGREQRARLVSLVGQGGIGKSRLAWELEKYLDGVVDTVWWHRGRAPSYGEGVTFWALGEMIRRRAGLAEGDDETTTRRAIDAMLVRHVPSAEERTWMAPRMLVLLGIGEMPSGGREELFAAWRTFFERLAATGTVALVFEDLQWSDDGLLDFLEHMLDWARTHPIFVLTLARPELLERRQGWGTDRRGATSMRLDPLSDDAMRELLEGIAPGLPAGVVVRILDRAAGIPLYAVETVRMLVSSGRLVAEGDRLVPISDLADLEVPPTLQALVAARLDALPAPDRALLQDAAVLGQTFTLPALAAMTGETPDSLVPRLASLVRREIFAVETDPRAPTRGQHAFVQALLREVTYSTLARRDRRARHLAAARYFESLGDDELAGVLATHYLAAYRATPEGPEGEAVAAQARLALLGAAERAEELGALGQAADAIRAALEVTPDPAGRAGLMERLGWVEELGSRHDEAAATLASAIEAYEAIGDRIGVLRASAIAIQSHLSASRIGRGVAIVEAHRADVAALEGDPAAAPAIAVFAEAVGRAAFRSSRFGEAIEWCDRALALAEPLRLDETLAMAMITKASALGASGHVRECIALLTGAQADARAHGKHVAALRAGVNLASFLVDLDPKGSLERSREGIALSRRLGMRSFDGYHAGNASGVAERVGEWAWIREALGEMLELDPNRGEATWIATCRDGTTAWGGEPDIERAERLLQVAHEDEDPQSIANLTGWLMRADFAAGRLESAIQRGRPILDTPRGGWAGDVAMFGRCAMHARDHDLVLRVIERLADSPGGAADADLATLRAGEAALAGRTAEAVATFRSALAQYRELGLRFDIALLGFDMAVLMGPGEPAAVEAAAEAREILVELGARRVVEQLDAAMASTTAVGGRQGASR